MANEPEKSLPVRILPDLFAFIFWLALAFILQWKTKDLVWSLWLSSLVIGYLTILSTLGAALYLGRALMAHPQFDQKHRQTAKQVGIGGVIFLLIFFSVHFCGFHA